MSYIYQKPLIGKNIGVVFGSFAPLHQGHLDIIMQAKKENDGGCIVIVCGYDGDKGEPLLPHSKRYRYVREFFSNDDMVAVYPINDTEIGIANYPNGWEGWLKEFDNIRNVAVTNQEASLTWYVGEEEYFEGLKERGRNAVLVNRKQNPITATMIRRTPLKHWNQIAHTFKKAFSHNILITGTASEGKTTLVQDLGKYFGTAYSYEWARDYMAERCVHDTELDAADFIAFLQGQFNLNQEKISSKENKGVFFADTDSLVTRMYAEYYMKDPTCKMSKQDFQIVADLADELSLRSDWYKIFLICPHGVFVDDTTRYMEHAGMRERNELYQILCSNLKRSILWDKVTILSGSYYENFITVKNYVQEIMNHE